jgi:integrase
MKLDAKAVSALVMPAGKTDHITWDDELTGLGYRLRLGAGGKILRSWIVQYRRAGASRRLLLGSAAVLGAEQARGMARKTLARIALGEDPQADRVDRRGKDRLTLRGVVDEYLAMKQREVRPRTLRGVTRYLTGDYFKPLHAMPVDKVSRKDIASRLLVITRERSSIVAGRARAALATFFVWAMQMGLVEHNPIIGTIKPKEGSPRERVLSDAELVAIWRACQDDDYGRIIRLLILLGARRQEIGGMRWAELDPGGTWTLQAARSKNKRAHTLPLMPMVLAIIESVPHMVSRDHLFGARSNGGFSAWDKSKQVLDGRSGVTAWTTHDIRRTFSTRLHDLGVAPHVVEQILGHSGHRAGSAGVYNRSHYEREVRAALALWADHVRALVEGGERKVLAFPQDAM